MNFEEFSQQYDEEWKKFPTDRVNRQIDKAKNKRDDLYKTANMFDRKFPKGAGSDNKGSSAAQLAREKASKQEKRRHTMTGVKNHRTKMTDAHKAKQKFVGSDHDKTQNKLVKQAETAFTTDKTNVTRKNIKKHDTLRAVANSNVRQYKGNNEKQAEVNKSDKEARRKAKSSLTRTKLEKLYKEETNKSKDWPSIKDAKPAKKTDVKNYPGLGIAPVIKKESMNYTEYSQYIESAKEPIYRVEGKLPQCPPGYVWSRERKDCIPKTDKDKISGKLQDNKDDRTPNSFTVHGRTGLNGDGYAYEEPFVRNTGDGGGVV